MKVDINKIPDALVDHPNFVYWKWTWIEARGKWDKPLISPLHDGYARTNRPEDWGSVWDLEESKYNKENSGIGFVFEESLGIVGIDLDDVYDPEAGEFSETARTILDKFRSYAEISPSKTGVKIWIKASAKLHSKKRPLPKEPGYQRQECEVYNTGRYFTFTSQQVGEYDQIEERQEELDWFLETYLPNKGRSGGASGDADYDEHTLVVIKEALSQLDLNQESGETADMYENWLVIGRILRSVEDELLKQDVDLEESLLDVWDNWSSQSSKYVDGACAEKWATFNDPCESTVGTIVHLAREANPDWDPPIQYRNPRDVFEIEVESPVGWVWGYVDENGDEHLINHFVLVDSVEDKNYFNRQGHLHVQCIPDTLKHLNHTASVCLVSKQPEKLIKQLRDEGVFVDLFVVPIKDLEGCTPSEFHLLHGEERWQELIDIADPVDLSASEDKGDKEQIFELLTESGLSGKSVADLPWPGILQDLFTWICKKDRRPQPVLAAAAVLTVGSMALAQRCQDPDETRSNLLLCGVAPAGKGKDNARKAATKLIEKLSFNVLTSVTSESAILRAIAAHGPTLLSWSEFGTTLKRISNPRASSSQSEIATSITELYSAVNDETVSKGFSNERDKISAPCPFLTVLGTTQPKVLYDVISSKFNDSGFLPRFKFFMGDPTPKPTHWRDRISGPMPNRIFETIRDIVYWREVDIATDPNLISFNAPTPDECVTVPKTDETRDIAQEFEEYCVGMSDKTGIEAWDRTPEFANKLALICAVFRKGRIDTAEIEPCDQRWANKFAEILTVRESIEFQHHMAETEDGALRNRIAEFCRAKHAEWEKKIARKGRDKAGFPGILGSDILDKFHLKTYQRDEAIKAMIETRMIVAYTPKAKKGRPAERYVPPNYLVPQRYRLG